MQVEGVVAVRMCLIQVWRSPYRVGDGQLRLRLVSRELFQELREPALQTRHEVRAKAPHAHGNGVVFTEYALLPRESSGNNAVSGSAYRLCFLNAGEIGRASCRERV